MAALNLGLLAISPRRITGDFAKSIRRAASESDRLAAAPCATGVVDRIALKVAGPVMLSRRRQTDERRSRPIGLRSAKRSRKDLCGGDRRINFCGIFRYRFTQAD